VTQGGSDELPERLCVRPTSETLFCDYYSKVIHSWRDLPKLYNQWGNVVRWEKTTRPFLRTTEFFWQEGHTMHETAEEAMEETIRILNIYAELVENVLAIPVIKGKKTDKEKFAGAVSTYTIEAMMHDGQALQSGTSHYFGDGFSRAFNIAFSGRDGVLSYPHQTSWGLSTRIIGGIIMCHGDNSGLVLPPAVAPTQAIVIPVAQHKAGVIEAASALANDLSKVARVNVDTTDNHPGWKFAEHEMKGIPLRVEIGPRDIKDGSCVVVRRDTREKIIVPLAEAKTRIPELLAAVRDSLYAKALANREARTFTARSLPELTEITKSATGFIKAMWCGDLACELKLKEEAGLTSRCVPFEQERVSETCVCCGKPASDMLYWGRAY
jgi:prolyl-tRNA synthetase